MQKQYVDIRKITLDFIEKAKKSEKVDKIIQDLYTSDYQEQTKIIRSLEGYIVCGNINAYKGLLDYYIHLPSVNSLEDVHHRVKIVEALDHKPSIETVKAFIVELMRSPSNNTTRQLFMQILKCLSKYPKKLVEEPLLELLKNKKFSYKFKQRLLAILDKDEEEDEFD